LCAECAFFLKHIVDHCLDTLLIIEPLEEFLLFGLVALPLPQQLHLVFQPRPPLPLQGRLLVALPLALLDRLPQLLHPQRQLLTTGKSLLHLLVDALIECVRLALLLLDQFVQILKQGVLSVEQMVGLLLKSHVLVEFVLLLHSQLLKLFIFVANEIVEGSYLLRYSTQILLILRYTLISLHILAQAFGELIDSALLRPHHKLQLLQNANQLQVLSLNLAVFRKNGIHVVLKLPDFGCDAMKVVALRGSDLGRRGGEDASV
jgi:hypothetical protein